MVGDIVEVINLPGRCEILKVGENDFLIKWIDDPNEEKWELYVPKNDII